MKNTVSKTVAEMVGTKGAGKTWYIAALYRTLLKKGIQIDGVGEIKAEYDAGLHDLMDKYENGRLENTTGFKHAELEVYLSNEKGNKRIRFPKIRFIDSEGGKLDGDLLDFYEEEHTHLIAVYSCAEMIANMRPNSMEQKLVDRYLNSANTMQHLEEYLNQEKRMLGVIKTEYTYNQGNVICIFTQFDVLFQKGHGEDEPKTVYKMANANPYIRESHCVFSSSDMRWVDKPNSKLFDLSPFYILLLDQIDRMDLGIMGKLKVSKLKSFLENEIKDSEQRHWKYWGTE